MGAKKLIVVHGMGQSTKESFKKQIVDALKTACGLYDSLQGVNVEDKVDIIPVAYNQVFDAYREQLKEQNGALGERIAAMSPSAALPVKVVQQINGLEARLVKDDFFATHWLDVILYGLTMLCEEIRLLVAVEVANAVGTVGGADVHVLGHSLGTAVVHDALAKAYGPDNLRTKDGRVLNLSTVEHRLGGVHMVANVSRALQTFVKVGSSVVRPGPLGCAGVFIEYRHKLDPITMIRAFNPTDNDGWVAHDVFESSYRLIEPSSVTEANVHDIGHYLKIPSVHQTLFRVLFGFRPGPQERQEGEAKYFSTTVEGKAKALQTAFGDLKQVDDNSVQDLLSAAKDLKDLVRGFGEPF